MRRDGHGGAYPEQLGRDLSIAGELKRSGLTAVCASFVLDSFSIAKLGEPRDNYLRWLTIIDGELAKAKMHRALNLKDLQAAHRAGRPAIVQTVEGAQFIEGKLERVEEVYQRGLRHLQLLRVQDDRISPLGDVFTSPPHLGGLTPFGVEVVKSATGWGYWWTWPMGLASRSPAP